MVTIARDTSPEAEKVMLGILRAMPVWQRLQLVDDACETARRLALAGLRSRYPEASATAVERMLKDLLLGEDLAETVYGPRSP